MANTVIRVALDPRPAETGARRVVRLLEEIARKAKETAGEIGSAEGALLRLQKATLFTDNLRLQPVGSAERLRKVRSADEHQPILQAIEGSHKETMGVLRGLQSEGQVGAALDQARSAQDKLASDLVMSQPDTAIPSRAPDLEKATRAQQDLNRVLEDGRAASERLGEAAGTAFQDYAAAAGNAAAQVEALVTKGLGGMEDALVGFVRTGKLEWRSLVDSMIEDLIRLFIRSQILGPLAQGLGGLFGPNTAPAGLGAVQVAAQGGILTGPALLASGRGLGLAGEAGPEAILPLARLPGGDLGVRSTREAGPVVNVFVNDEDGRPAEVRQRSNGRGGADIEVVIARAVERDINAGGRVAKSILGLTDARPALAGR